MYMFLPFLSALTGLVCIWFDKRRTGFAFFLITLIILLAWFRIHATDSLFISL